MHDLVLIKDRIVNTGFPELSQSIDISLAYKKKVEGAYLDVSWLGGNKYSINIHTSMRRSSLDVLEGGIAHELAHVARDYNMPWFAHEIAISLYMNWSWYATRDELQTDLFVVARGYGQKLLKFKKFAKQRMGEIKNGLTIEELERMLASIDLPRYRELSISERRNVESELAKALSGQ